MVGDVTPSQSIQDPVQPPHSGEERVVAPEGNTLGDELGLQPNVPGGEFLQQQGSSSDDSDAKSNADAGNNSPHQQQREHNMRMIFDHDDDRTTLNCMTMDTLLFCMIGCMQ